MAAAIPPPPPPRLVVAGDTFLTLGPGPGTPAPPPPGAARLVFQLREVPAVAWDAATTLAAPAAPVAGAPTPAAVAAAAGAPPGAARAAAVAAAAARAGAVTFRPLPPQTAFEARAAWALASGELASAPSPAVGVDTQAVGCTPRAPPPEPGRGGAGARRGCATQ